MEVATLSTCTLPKCHTKTLKKKKSLNAQQKAKLWEIYDNDKNANTDSVDDISTANSNFIEQTEFCIKCQTLMIYTED